MWYVNLDTVGEIIHVQLRKELVIDTEYSIYVYPPNWVERLFRLSFKDKLDTALNIVTKRCGIRNELENKTKELVNQYEEYNCDFR